MWEKFAQNTVTSYVDDKALQIVSGTWTFREKYRISEPSRHRPVSYRSANLKNLSFAGP